MKITGNLLTYLQDRFEEMDLSYAELGKRSGTNYQNFQRLLQGKTHEITQLMQDAICEAFNISADELFAIAKGRPASVITPPADHRPRPAAIEITDPEGKAFVLDQCFALNITPAEYINQLIKAEYIKQADQNNPGIQHKDLEHEIRTFKNIDQSESTEKPDESRHDTP